MLNLFIGYQNTHNQDYLVQLVNHAYIRKVINYHINVNDLFEAEDIKNNLFIKLLERADRLSFNQADKFRSYLSITTKGLVLNERRALKQKEQKYQEEIFYEDEYNLSDLPAPIKLFLEDNPTFAEFTLTDMTAKELAKKYGVTTKTISKRNSACRAELKDYFEFTNN